MYQLQTKLYHVEDTLVTWGPIRLTLRQCFVLVLGGCGSLNLWRVLDGLAVAGDTGFIIRITLASIPSLLAILVAMVRVADRYAEAWAVVLLQYVTRVHIYVWLPQEALHASRQRSSRRRRSAMKTDRDHTREDELV